jgi:hypothetical protein
MSENEKLYTPPPVTGYRALTQTEVDLMNTVKAQGVELLALLATVGAHLQRQREEAAQGHFEMQQHLEAAQPERWAAIARTHFQEGLMALTRSVAQPEFL